MSNSKWFHLYCIIFALLCYIIHLLQHRYGVLFLFLLILALLSKVFAKTLSSCHWKRKLTFLHLFILLESYYSSISNLTQDLANLDFFLLFIVLYYLPLKHIVTNIGQISIWISQQSLSRCYYISCGFFDIFQSTSFI